MTALTRFSWVASVRFRWLIWIQHPGLDRRMSFQRRYVLSQLDQSRLRDPGVRENHVLALLRIGEQVVEPWCLYPPVQK